MSAKLRFLRIWTLRSESKGVAKVVIILLAAILASCSLNDVPEGCIDSSLLEPLPAGADFIASGTIIITSEEQKHKVNFFWQQTKKQYEIAIFGPLGIPIAEINGNERIKLAGEDNSYSLKEFMLQRLNYYISPVTLRGILLGSQKNVHDVEVRAISYSCGYAYRLPNKVTLQLPLSDVALDIRITNWQL